MPRVPASTNPLTGVDTARPSEARGASSFPIPTGPRDRRAIFAADEIARMPLGERKPGAIVTGNGHFFNPGEVLAHVLFGPERKPVGPVRICGMNPKAKVDMLAYKGKKNRNYEMAFHSLCTRDEYGYLCDQIAQQGMTNKLWCNAWMEGFRDTNENLFHMADYLRENSLMAIYYPADQRGNVWLAYSPRCPEFDFLSHDSLAVPDGVPIRLAVRAPLTPISAVETRPAALNVEHLIGSNKPSGPYALGSASSRPPSQPVSTGQDPRLNAHTQGQPHEQGVAASKSSDQNMAASLDPRLRRRGSMATSLPPARPSTSHEPPVVSGPGSAPGTDLVSGNSPRADPMDIQVPVSPPYEQTIIQVDDPKLALRRVFEDTLCISIDTLSQLPPSKEVPDESNSTDMFYLQFPEDEAGQAELKLLEEWLRLYDKKIWSNRDPAGWSKFCHNCKYGSVIVHEDKLFDLMKLRPPVYKFLWSHRVNFFSMKIAKPLALRDGRFFPEAAHYQAILAWGGAFLITEDLFLHDLRSTAMIICWFHYYHRETAGPCKLIVRPGILDALDARLENSKAKSEQINALLTVIAWVMKVNSIDSSHPTFDPASFDSRYMDRPNNNIITLPLLDYGSRSESDDHSIPRGLTQSERNADHLVDAFSGWTIIHSALVRRSIVITSVKNARLWDRWKTWGHIYPCTPNKFFEMHQINEEQLWDRVQSDGIPHLAAKFSTNSPVAPPGQASVAQPDDNQQVAFPSPVKDSSSSDEQRWRAPSHLQDPRQSLKSTSAPPK
ncbi:hypothetical protein N7492_001966 [Penicillium capsulatum]|uniref:Uncharacterized protein n=1 Tax=Penicillium capsulatum TaxID=69766 RepID=A0A9W9IN60_9EURO|nr:hypothetical protein N7492_001966 [Penicillium capsulatum]